MPWFAAFVPERGARLLSNVGDLPIYPGHARPGVWILGCSTFYDDAGLRA